MSKHGIVWAVVLLAASLLLAVPVAGGSRPGAAGLPGVAFDDEVLPEETLDEDALPPVTNPLVQWLAAELEITPEEVLDLLEEYGVGLGGLVHAVQIQQMFGDAWEMDLEDLLVAHRDGAGWGQYKAAYRWALRLGGGEEPADLAVELLDRKLAGEGWGQMTGAGAPEAEYPDETIGDGVDDQAPRAWGREDKPIPPGQARKNAAVQQNVGQPTDASGANGNGSSNGNGRGNGNAGNGNPGNGNGRGRK